MPDHYRTYYQSLTSDTYHAYDKAADAKSTLVDTSAIVEPKVVFDLSDRVAKMHDIDIAKPLRELLAVKNKELSALDIAGRIAKGQYLPEGVSLEERLDMAVRVGLAVVTEGVTIAPLQGINSIDIGENRDGTKYLSVSIAGPMRSAGGTESAVTMLIADHVRSVVGLDKYQANSYGDDETGRFVEELRIYERDASNFQYRVRDEDITYVISHLPIELAGVDTDPYEVVNHRGMHRIKTDRVRGGALRVLNDGLIGRSKKLLKRIEMYGLEGWGWLEDLKGVVKTGDQEDAAAKRMKEVITGRSVLSTAGTPGGFRLRYGRACNTGFATVGVHPTMAEILEYTVVAGTQVKMDIPGKGATIAFVDSIDTPIVLLKNGGVVKIRDLPHAIQIKREIKRILHLGDILVSFGDFLENNATLVPTAYVEEYWREDLASTAGKNDVAFLDRTPTLDEALDISERLGIPLHPKYLYYWDLISSAELQLLLEPEGTDPGSVVYGSSAKRILEKLGVPHVVRDGFAVLEGDEAGVFHRILLAGRPSLSIPVVEALSASSGITIRPKFSTSVGVRIGRPEKAAPRNMKPPIHSLFPVGEKGGQTRDIVRASKATEFYTDTSLRACLRCGVPAPGIVCRRCGDRTVMTYLCQYCRSSLEEPYCDRCQKQASSHSYRSYPLKSELDLAQERTGYRAKEPFKGVRDLIGQDRAVEPLEKGLLRQAHNITVFKDGTVRFDATNSTLTHFRPSWIGTSVEKLRQLGYTHDMHGKPLRDANQTVELLVQDIILPAESGRFFVDEAAYMDELLTKFFGKSKFYNIREPSQLVGHLVVGLAPHTSVGIVGRVIGFTNTHVCYATPNWHSAKRRDADGDADSLMLLMDAFLNFSKNFLSDKIGGLMDAPLLIQPMVVPHESQPQAHNLEVCSSFPLEFYGQTAQRPKAATVKSIELIKDRLGTVEQFSGYLFTHHTNTLVTSKSRSAYSSLGSMLDKLDLQIKNADLIDAVDTSEIVTHVISTHLVPDIMGNLRSYARQRLRCTACGRDYRRAPLSGLCVCGRKPIQTISRASVEKYLKLARRLVDKYDVGDYQRDRIRSLSEEIDLLFGKNRGDQMLLTDYTG